MTQIENTDSALPSIDIIGLCETYDEEGYEEMEEDFPRNRAYCRAISGLNAVHGSNNFFNLFDFFIFLSNNIRTSR